MSRYLGQVITVTPENLETTRAEIRIEDQREKVSVGDILGILRKNVTVWFTSPEIVDKEGSYIVKGRVAISKGYIRWLFHMGLEDRIKGLDLSGEGSVWGVYIERISKDGFMQPFARFDKVNQEICLLD